MTEQPPSGPPLIAVIGATGTGKSEFAIEVAEALRARGRDAEILNSDAMQLYRGMDIGTAKLSVPERRGIPHHLFDVLDVAEESTVAGYQALARPLIAELRERGTTPILVGGSGLYVSAACFDFRFPGADPAVRAELERRLAEEGLDALRAELRRLDPEGAERIDTRNPRRVVRALEVLIVTGEPAASALPEAPVPVVPTLFAGLQEERPVLTERLDRRVERMWRDGLLAEVAALVPLGLAEGPTASRAIGYAQALGQLAGSVTEAEAIEQTQALTRRYARRQASWFRRTRGTRWFPSTGGDRAAEIRATVTAASDAEAVASWPSARID
ncbi:tRNA (adenosine(37)-N6)-dimethylallyltransferase MiaA [Leucobacter sp. M11]|uniref:tRNA (adenosine(37)-N6)-dimethylallyltransferase MiaA n=1 Tax=Leucobacter sp. M11 TaxID=2993565 RepID=UPI002D7E84EF|nr:tRNA (adenosine(37)-N6)-dimethylallyltransferase MiaA [Leucobacter sp. M11]MEB4615901.1 tRNA (adenosine(37)-N6)-dimethylallyltransferase MiaA [Leucobacter sp. M11]